MSDLALAIRQVRFENKAFWRNPFSAFFTFAFPLMFLVIFNLVFGGGTYRGFGRPVSTSTFYTPAIVAFSVITACFTNIAMAVTIARDQGVLKRLRGTPMPPWVYLAGRIVHAVLVSLLLVVIVVAFGRVFYDVAIPMKTLAAFLAALGAGAATFCSLGLAMSALIPNAEAAPAIVNATILPLLFISDIFIPLEKAPHWLVSFSSIFPVKHFGHAVLTAFNPFTSGSGIVVSDLAVMGLWCAAGIAVALRFFSWEPAR